MKRLCICLCAFVCTVHSGIMAESNLLAEDQLVRLIEKTDCTVITKSHHNWTPKSSYAHSVQKKKIEGVRCVIADYKDFGTVTILSGPSRNQQAVLRHVKGQVKVMYKAKSWKKRHGKLIHKYSWGKIISSKKGQQVIKK